MGLISGTYVSRVRNAVDFTPTPADQQAPKLSVLRQKKPEWNDKAEVWTDLHVLYIGGYLIRQNAMRFLWRRPKEDGNVYSVRVDHVTYHNLLGTGLGWFAAELFELAPEIGMLQEEENGPGTTPTNQTQFFYDHKFFKNCDRNGTSFVNFWRDMMIKMLTFGEVWGLVDLPVPPSDPDKKPKSLQDQLNQGLLDPHLISFTPMQVTNYMEDESGVMQWCVVQTTVQEQHFLEKPYIVDRWYYFDKTTYRVYEYRRKKDDANGETTVQVTPSGAANLTSQNAPMNQAMASDRDPEVPLVMEGLHALAEFGRCPIRRYKLPDNLWIANRAYLPLLDHFNQDNTLAWALFMANLAMPVIIGDVDLTNQVLSEMGFIQLPEGCSYKWTEPEGKSFKVSADRVDQLREEIYRSMYLYGLGREQSQTAGAASGFSKQMDFMAASDILDALGEVIIEGMQNMLIDVADAHGDDGLVFDVRGFHFEDHVTLQEIETIDKAINMMIPSQTFEKELYRLVCRAFLKDANPELFEQIIEEIKAGPTRLQSQKDMMLFEASLGLKPSVYLKERGSRTPGDLSVSSSGTPTEQPYQQKPDDHQPIPGGDSYQAAAGAARGKSKVQKGPTTRPSKKAN